MITSIRNSNERRFKYSRDADKHMTGTASVKQFSKQRCLRGATTAPVSCWGARQSTWRPAVRGRTDRAARSNVRVRAPRPRAHPRAAQGAPTPPAAEGRPAARPQRAAKQRSVQTSDLRQSNRRCCALCQ